MIAVPDRSAAPLLLQAMLAAAALGGLLLAPPARGQMLLVPLSASVAAALPARAIRGETRLVAAGPLPGSLVVDGRRGELLPLLGGGTLVLASVPAGCGA